jgi:8-oxo-dGTP pyrophosphatase MutT (NUDIX family)
MIPQIIDAYLKHFPDEAKRLERLSKQLAGSEPLNTRENRTGHVTGSGIVLSPDRKKVLLIYHKILRQWFQPGGHMEHEDSSPLAAAQREVIEETAIQPDVYLALDPGQSLVPMDIDVHFIPANDQKHEPEHYHYDFRYVFVTNSMHTEHRVSEVEAAEWFAFTTPEASTISAALAKLRNLQLID